MRKFLVFLPLSRHAQICVKLHNEKKSQILPLSEKQRKAAVLDFVRKCVKVSNW